MATSTLTVRFPETILLDLSDSLMNFMDQFNAERKYELYDYQYMGKVMQALSPAFVYERIFDQQLGKAMTAFTDCQLYYSDETYNPSHTADMAYRLGRKIFETLKTYGGYHQGLFPYQVEQIGYDLVVVFRHNPALLTMPFYH